MQRLEIKAFIKNGRIIINGDLQFDGILYHQLSYNQYGSDKYWNYFDREIYMGNDKNITNALGKLIKIHTNEHLEFYNTNGESYYSDNRLNSNIHLASNGIYEIKKEITENIRKRFEEQKFEKYGLTERKIYTSSGQYKNYNIRRRIILTPFVYWICIGHKDEINKLINQITHIGKEKNIGYGEIEKWEIKETKEKGIRYFHSTFFEKFETIEYKRVCPPYHIKKNLLLCSKKYF